MIEFFGSQIRDLPKGWTPLGVAVVVKCLDENGNVAFSTRISDDVNKLEEHAMFAFGAEQAMDDMRRVFRPLP